MLHSEAETSPFYAVQVERGLLDGPGTTLLSAIDQRRALVVTSPGVFDHYGQRLVRLLAGVPAQVEVLPLRESNKTMAAVMHVCELARVHGLGRRDLLVGFGGGVVTDVVSVAASLYRRGVPCLRLPTSLIGQVDAGIAVKSAVNAHGVKSALGCFHAPERVLCDPTWLSTLPQRALRAGMAEIVKMGAIRDVALLDLIAADGHRLVMSGWEEPTIAADLMLTLATRLMLLELHANPFEEELRRAVDFGHTWSPILETASKHRLNHGEAVAIDIAISARLARRIGVLDSGDADQLIAILARLGLPTTSHLVTAELLGQAADAAVAQRGGALNLVLPAGLGHATFVTERLELTDDLLRSVAMEGTTGAAQHRVAARASSKDLPTDEGQAVVVGGAGFVGTALVSRLMQSGADVIVIDRHGPDPLASGPIPNWTTCDLLADLPLVPDGPVLLVSGTSTPRPRRPWTLVLDNAMTTARLAPVLRGRRVVLLSSIEAYGAAPGPLREDTEPVLPIARGTVERWCDRALQAAAAGPTPPWRAYELCEELAELDPTGRWVYALSKLAQEIIVRRVVDPTDLTIVRAANIFGRGQTRVLSRIVHAIRMGRAVPVRAATVRTFVRVERVAQAMAARLDGGLWNIGGQHISLVDLAHLVGDELGMPVHLILDEPDTGGSCGVVDDSLACSRLGPGPALEGELRDAVRAMVTDETPLFRPPLQVVLPPRPEHPERTANRQQSAMWSGMIKHGGPWTERLEAALVSRLALGPSRRLVVTASGTAALRLAVLATVGSAPVDAVAALPSFTFPATGEVLRQLGYRLRFVDVDAANWTMDPEALDRSLTLSRADLVVSVDALGNPPDYDRLRAVCARHDVPLVADSAAALGATYDGQPVGTQLPAHAFSMSFAKTVSAGGAGGALVVPAEADLECHANWLRSSLMHELHAAAALDQVEILGDLVARRAALAAVYDTAATRWSGVVPQQPSPGAQHAYVHWVARFERAADLDRDRVGEQLARLGVQTKPYYAPVLHRSDLGDGTPPEDLPVTELLADEVLALPLSSEMTVEEAERVVMALDRILLPTCDRSWA